MPFLGNAFVQVSWIGGEKDFVKFSTDWDSKQRLLAIKSKSSEAISASKSSLGNAAYAMAS